MGPILPSRNSSGLSGLCVQPARRTAVPNAIHRKLVRPDRMGTRPLSPQISQQPWTAAEHGRDVMSEQLPHFVRHRRQLAGGQLLQRRQRLPAHRPAVSLRRGTRRADHAASDRAEHQWPGREPVHLASSTAFEHRPKPEFTEPTQLVRRNQPRHIPAGRQLAQGVQRQLEQGRVRVVLLRPLAKQFGDVVAAVQRSAGWSAARRTVPRPGPRSAGPGRRTICGAGQYCTRLGGQGRPRSWTSAAGPPSPGPAPCRTPASRSSRCGWSRSSRACERRGRQLFRRACRLRGTMAFESQFTLKQCRQDAESGDTSCDASSR